MAIETTVPPQVGVPVDKNSLNAKLGSNAQALRKASAGLSELQDWAAAYTAADLVTLYGFTQEEADAFKGCCTEASTVQATVDGLQWMPKAWGA